MLSNGYALDPSPHRLARLTASEPGEPLRDLAEPLRSKGLSVAEGPSAARLGARLRSVLFAQFVDTGLLLPGSDPVEGKANPNRKAEDGARKKLMEIVRSAAYETFCLKPHLWRFLDEFLGGMCYLHKRKMRVTRPAYPSSTGTHYDLVYLRGDTNRLVTAWIPIGDVPARMGGLVYLEGSHGLGRKLGSGVCGSELRAFTG
jgi:hypothetical protein